MSTQLQLDFDADVRGTPLVVLPANTTRRAKNPEKKRAHDAAYYAENRERIRSRQNARYVEHRDEILTKQRAYHRTPAGRAVQHRSAARQRAAHPEQIKARDAVNHAIAAGRLTRDPCERCGNPETHGHHHLGYAPEHQLDVIWLCHSHHAREHATPTREQSTAGAIAGANGISP
jgi:hypothetical protein